MRHKLGYFIRETTPRSDSCQIWRSFTDTRENTQSVEDNGSEEETVACK